MARKPRHPVLEGTPPIDRASFEPAYVQLVNILRQSIAAGVLRPGDQLPSESQLCEQYAISPMTVRRAINILVDQGVISAYQGRGTFVRSVELGSAVFTLNGLPGLFGDSRQATVKLLEVRVLKADEHVACRLGLAPGQRVIYLRRLLSTGGQPAFLHRGYLVYDPARPIVEAEMEVTSLQALFSGGAGSLIKRGELSVEATLLTADEARLLQAPLPTAALRLEHLFYDFDECPLSWGWFIGRADGLRLSTQVGLPPALARPLGEAR
jgi:GntR family transcriptional regulator